ncbi:MAG: Crp/Fnr family transcriptional regulator [Thermoleophilia bacterium]
MRAAGGNGTGQAAPGRRPADTAPDPPLGRIPPFHGLPAPLLAAVEAHSQRITWREGDAAPALLGEHGHLFAVRHGRIGLLGAAPSGRRSIVAIIERGAVHTTLGEWTPPDAVALMDTVLTAVSARVLERLSARHPPFALDLAAALSDRVAMTMEVVAGLGQTHLEDRLWARLLALAGRIGVATAEGVELHTRLTHAQWALLAGGSRESVTLAFGRLQRAGRLRIGDDRVLIPWPQFSPPGE